MKYRIQVSDHLGIVQRGWGFGRCVKWGPWRTVATFASELAAREHFLLRVPCGLSRKRLVRGREVIITNW